MCVFPNTYMIKYTLSSYKLGLPCFLCAGNSFHILCMPVLSHSGKMFSCSDGEWQLSRIPGSKQRYSFLREGGCQTVNLLVCGYARTPALQKCNIGWENNSHNGP